MADWKNEKWTLRTRFWWGIPAWLWAAISMTGGIILTGDGKTPATIYITAFIVGYPLSLLLIKMSFMFKNWRRGK